MTAIGVLGSALLAALGFLLGRLYNESERILVQKRRVYEEYLRVLPTPNSAYKDMDDSAYQNTIAPSLDATPVLMLYASPTVAAAASTYLQAYEEACELLSPTSPPLAPEYMRLAKSQNDVILEMRRDAFAWSTFAHRGASRVPPAALASGHSQKD